MLDVNHLSFLIEKFDKNTSLIFCSSNYIDSNGKISKIKQIEKSKIENINYYLSLENFINSCGLIFSKDKFMKVKGFEYNSEYPNYGEWLLWLKLLEIGTIRYEDNIKSYYRRHETNMTNSFKKRKTLKIVSKYFINCQNYVYKTQFSKFNLNQKIYFITYYIKNWLRIYF